MEHPIWGPTRSLPKHPANIPTPRHHPTSAEHGSLAPPFLSTGSQRAHPHPRTLLLGGCFTSPHPSGSPRQHRGKYLQRNEAILSFFPNPCAATGCKLTPGPTACAQEGTAPCLPAAQSNKCGTRIGKARTHPPFSICRNTCRGKSLCALQINDYKRFETPRGKNSFAA